MTAVRDLLKRFFAFLKRRFFSLAIIFGGLGFGVFVMFAFNFLNITQRVIIMICSFFVALSEFFKEFRDKGNLPPPGQSPVNGEDEQ